MATVTLSTPATHLEVARPVVTFDAARTLAADHGTPLLAISRRAIRRSFAALRAALPAAEFFYAVKANPEPAILKTLASVECAADVCTHQELTWAQSAGFAPGQMIHTHPCKSPRDIAACYAAGCRWFSFDSPHELPKLAQHAPGAKLLLRLAVPAGSSVIHLSAKFGADPQHAAPLVAEAEAMGLAVGGLSFHVGSQCIRPEDFLPALALAREVWDEIARVGGRLDVLDIGGGFPAAYREPVTAIDTFCRPLSAALDDLFGDIAPRLIAEPGRVLCAQAVTLITSVLGKSVRSGRPWYFLDDGLYGSFSGKAFDHADFPLLVDGADRRRCRPCVVAGPTCDSGDVVSTDQDLPDLDIGELVLVPTMGAYTSASATDFNGLPRARSVVVD